jgi:hypothetical protein
MCPFCISAMVVLAAKAVAATGGGAILTKVVLNRTRKTEEAYGPALRDVQQSDANNSSVQSGY